MMQVISQAGGSSVQEVAYASVPDIVFNLGGYKWLCSVKIGQEPRIVKDAFVQYLRHKEESGIPFGIVVFLPEGMRAIPPSEALLRSALDARPVAALIDAGDVKEEIRDRAFPGVVGFLLESVLPRQERREHAYFPLGLVISLLREQVLQTMDAIDLSETRVLKLVTSRRLLMDLGHLRESQAEAVTTYLASYILLSQLLFLRLLHAAKPGFLPPLTSPVTPHALRAAFARILDLNYRPIYELDVLDAIPAEFLRDTFDLIWGLQIERVRTDLPGRIFHDLMPAHIRKMLAAFYTRPLAADLLARLTIDRSDATVFDPACGSGTILVSAYHRKLDLLRSEGIRGNPHGRFCEEEIFGADIMPFAVHLASANLAAIDAGTIIDRTQIIREDSLRLVPGRMTRAGPQLDMFPVSPRGRKSTGEEYEVPLRPVDAVLMNPPFTKVERGIRAFVDMEKFVAKCGGEIGLWGHFLSLAGTFTVEGGRLGAVIPINILRGRESGKVRETLLSEWQLQYVLKSVRNYGFSEWAEYRDILLIARRGKPGRDHAVKFCLVKKNLTKLTEDDVADIAAKAKSRKRLRSADLDIDSVALRDVQKRFPNLMWFCGTTDFGHRDALVGFLRPFLRRLGNPPANYFREGYRPVPAGVSKFLFLTRDLGNSRIEEAFLRFAGDSGDTITAWSPLDASYEIEASALRATLRTPVGLATMDISGKHDYIADKPYGDLSRVRSAAGFNTSRLKWPQFWTHMRSDLGRTGTNLVACHRINPFSPAHHHAAFWSREPIFPSNQMNVVREGDAKVAKAVCAVMNSVVFLTQFFMLKEESTGRYINVRFYDLEQMALIPDDSRIPALVRVFDRFARREFPPLRYQLDASFDQRYSEFVELEKRGHLSLFSSRKRHAMPAKVRLDFDLAVCKALGVRVTAQELRGIYTILVNEMLFTQALASD